MNLDAKTAVCDTVPPPAQGRLMGRFTALLRRAATQERRSLRCLETLTLGPRRVLYLVECDGKRFLAGGGSDGIHTLLPLDRPSGTTAEEMP